MEAREVVLSAFHAACTRVDVAGRVREALRDDGSDDRIVIAAGKVAATMLDGVDRFSAALVVVPRGTEVRAARHVRVFHAGHPLPDESSLQAATEALAFASSAAPGQRLFLISGGASSLLCAPAPGLDLAAKRDIVAALLAADAPIAEVNVVRRHLSRIKGGGLARTACERPRRTLVVSDVIDGGVFDVGSGPSVADPTTIEDARRVAARLGLGELPWVETWKEPERAEIVAGPALFASLLRDELETRGLRDVDVTMAEPAMRIPVGAGRGGRCSHAAAVASLSLPPSTLFAAIATDGVDGTSGTAGAIVLGPLPGAREAIDRFDTGPLHIAAGTAILSAPTGLNFADAHVRARY